MKDLAATLAMGLCPCFLTAQPIVDLGLYPNANADTLEVRLRASGDFSLVLSGLTFSIRWPDAASAWLGTGVASCPNGIYPTPVPLEVNGGYQYKTYNAFGISLLSDEGCPLIGGQEMVILRIPVEDNDGIDQFHIVNDAWTAANNRDFFLSLSGIDRTGIIYSEVQPGPGNGILQGMRYLDQDGDCVMEALDQGIPYRVMRLLPGPIPFITSTDGHFDALAPAGSYTLDQQLETGLHAACPLDELVPVNVIEGNVDALTLANTADDLVDIEVQLIVDYPVIGFDSPVYLLARNNGFSTSGPVSLSFTYDAGLDLVSINDAPDNVSGSTLEWEIPQMNAFQTKVYEMHFAVPAEPSLIGTIVGHAALVVTDVDADPTNNTISLPATVVGSYDPNDKTAWTSSGASTDQYFIDLDDAITYRIRFQNTGTFPASTVVITDTLDESLDMLTFQQGPASHPFDVRFLPGRVVEWTFDDINLPDSVSNEPESHGLVSFRIKPVQPLVAGTPISNTANIYFDFNPPVITEPSMLTAEFSTGSPDLAANGAQSVYPNPVSSMLQITLPGDVVGLRIRAGDGREVMTRSGLAGVSAIDVQRLPSGAYSVEVMKAGGVVQRVRFIKQ